VNRACWIPVTITPKKPAFKREEVRKQQPFHHSHCWDVEEAKVDYRVIRALQNRTGATHLPRT
jgi:hypothetical protein